MQTSVETRLRELGITLPPASRPLASYAPVVIAGQTAFVSGHGPLIDGHPRYTGCIGRDIDETEACDAARLTTINLLSTLHDALGSLETIAGIVEIRIYLQATADSDAHILVPAAVYRFMQEIFGQRADACALATIGISACVLNLPITIDLVVELNSTPPLQRRLEAETV